MLSQAHSVLSNVVSNETSNRISADNALSQAISILSQQISVISQQVSTLSATGGYLVLQNNDAAAVSAGCPVYLFTSANTFKKADADAGGVIQDVVGLVVDNSIAVSATGRVQFSGRIVLTTGQWDNITGQTGGLTAGSKYFLDTTAGKLTTTAPATGVVRPVGIALSTTELLLTLSQVDVVTSALNLISNAASNALSVGNAASNAASIVSQALSVQAAALSVRIDTQSQSVSVLSQAVSIISQQVSALSQAHSVLSQTVSNEISNRTSADNVLSNAISIVSNAVSIVSTAASNALSVANAASNAASIVSTAASNALSVANAASNAASIVSNALSNEISNRTSADNVLSQAISVISQQVSVISAGLGGVQLRVVGNAQVISAASFTNISGLSISVASAAVYRIEGRVLFTVSTVTGTAFGFTYPGGVGPGVMTMEWASAQAGTPVNLVSTNYILNRITEASMSTVATAQLSMLGVSATTNELEIYGVITTSTTAGTVQLQAKQSATGGGVQILKGSYLQAFKIA